MKLKGHDESQILWQDNMQNSIDLLNSAEEILRAAESTWETLMKPLRVTFGGVPVVREFIE